MVSPYPTVGVITATDLLTDARVFPQLPGMDFLIEKTPIFSTGVKSSSSGREIRSAYFPYPLYRFSVRANFLRNDVSHNELKKLLAFFNSQQGRYGAFYYLEQEDYAVVDEPFGTGDASTKIFQLYRDVGKTTVYSAKEPVYAAWTNPVVKVNGTGTGGFTMDVWGRVNFTVAPASGAALTWTGNCMYVCAFEDDEMSLAQMMSKLWSQDGLPFRSIRP